MIEISVRKKFSPEKVFYYNFKTGTNKIVLFGPSGSGKSNLIKMIVGFLNPDEGVIKVNGLTYFNNNFHLPIHKRKIGYLPQEYTLFPHMTVKENILYGVKVNKIELNIGKFSYLIERLELNDKLSMYPHQLSGGEKQRVALVRAILINPDILLFDEPFSALDTIIKDKLRDAILDILDETGIKAIFVTHDLQDAFILGKEVFVIYNGKIIESGSADKIFTNPEYVETAKMINFKNIWDLNKFNKLIFKTHFNNSDFIAIKPEHINFNNNDIVLNGILKKIRYIGDVVEATFFYNDMKIILEQPKSYFHKYSLKENSKSNISFSTDNLIPLKMFNK